MQAITTKFLSPTNTMGSRYRAYCDAGTVTLSAEARFAISQKLREAPSSAHAVLIMQEITGKLKAGGWVV